jgi:hypothetical protein
MRQFRQDDLAEANGNGRLKELAPSLATAQ